PESIYASMCLHLCVTLGVCLTDAANTVIPITLSPPKPTKGQNIFLIPGLDYENFTSCGWYRGVALTSENLRLIISSQSEFYIKGDAYTGREKLCANCSLHIKHCETEDMGMYTIIMKGSMIAVGEVNLNVSGATYLFLWPFDLIDWLGWIGLELHPVSFFCSAPKDLMITWFKDGELYTSESHLSDNNKTLSIASVTKSDAGGYQCQITNHTSRRISDILSFNVVCKYLAFKMSSLVLALKFTSSEIMAVATGRKLWYGPDTPAIQPTQRYYNEHTNVVLTCKADSFPQPRYIWFHNGKEIDTGQKLLLEDFTEDKTGSYICQAGNDLLQKKRNSSSLEIYLEKSEIQWL
uniref:Ig-like domain-containing protein n=1 Tax=Naja naja TaxID=35670 RepID=A0A8C6Y010_NAJNA